ncbi:MAG: ABC transporter permease [Candidatus Marinimicrobia bacterium]|nr:ABC transporter permease [Candidatus Neomarinimicrobiota bacterium]MBL7022742.1 ABC transporter permease [Candidatus Neomarinimicrobiota bacterium]MBL7109619.1 ABC transporter permease [Candidatus Neomarinimicrobiota bacterium]
MTVYRKIAFRQLRAKHSFGFISFTSILSIIGLLLGVAFLIMISAFSNGFSSAIEDKLSSLDGHLRIQKYNGYELVDENDLSYLDSLLHSNLEFASMTPYIEKRVMVRKGNATEGLMIYGIEQNSLQTIFGLEKFIIEGKTTFTNPNSIIIGNELAKQLEVNIDDKLVLFDIEKLISENLVIANNYIVSGIIKTGFPEYDKLLAFVSFEGIDLLFGNTKKYDGVISNFTKPEQIAKVDEVIANNLDFPFSTTTWKERHANLFEWLNIYDIPILLLMVFIIIVAVFNISATLWMIVVEKSKNIGILLTMGFNQMEIRKIFLLEGLIIGGIGSLFGLFFAILVLFFQAKYHFISLSSDIYFMDYLPVKMSLKSLIMYPVFAILLTLIASSIPSFRASKVEPAEAVRYE